MRAGFSLHDAGDVGSPVPLPDIQMTGETRRGSFGGFATPRRHSRLRRRQPAPEDVGAVGGWLVRWACAGSADVVVVEMCLVVEVEVVPGSTLK